MNNIHKFKIRFSLLVIVNLVAQVSLAQNSENQSEFNAFVKDLESNFIYYEDKSDIIECIKQAYSPYVDTISHPYYKVLFYENLLNELYDSHINLNTNTDKSYRLSSPIYVKVKNDRYFIANVFSSQLENKFSANIINAEVLSFNSFNFQQVLTDFPTRCHNKNDPRVKEWLANKILAGKRHEPRILGLKLDNGKRISLDIDSLSFKTNNGPLESSRSNNIGIIRINNSLGNSDLVAAFDKALNSLNNTEALVLDLRNTPSGGNTDVAEPIIGRFISSKGGYQLCENENEKYTRFVFPRDEHYSKPLYILVGRWTGSMGEGMAIGFDGLNRATIVGTEMNRLAGGMKTISFLNSNFGFRISFEKMYHLDGSLRENFVPEEYVNQESTIEDEHMMHAMKLIKAGSNR